MNLKAILHYNLILHKMPLKGELLLDFVRAVWLNVRYPPLLLPDTLPTYYTYSAPLMLPSHSAPIDVDIGSSSVARSVITLVLGYVTSIVVDLAILIEAKEEVELPEYILGTVRLNRVKLDSAVPFEV
ncbi:hypothetical protein HYC85_004071 [Camellia sinensis]|uniref:Protein ENHANCED DISEASE RESISTANCE 2 C-terminal domain-containing protein n=1 Tax=Camellia sinensis TaxID=4442 RepID=A0A7J7HXJ9_CAMSI|nr:hypothetical protein HYC85_004071 [Camellia sinensis]